MGYKADLAVRPSLKCITVLFLEGGVAEGAVPLARNDPGQVETVRHGNYRTGDVYSFTGAPKATPASLFSRHLQYYAVCQP